MKKEVKKSFLGALLASSMFLAMNNVDALTIKETTNVDDATLDKITEGSILMGSTKFEPNVVLTALRASKATYNDVMLNLDNPNYQGVNIYYYLAGAWYTVDDNNKVSPVDSEEVLNALNISDIYYINNKEKMLEVNYIKDIKDGYELVFETENPDRNKDVLYKDGIIYVPATIQNVEIFVKNIEIGSKEKLDVLSRDNMTDDEFKVVSSQGKIEKGDATGGNLDYVVDGNKITINGEIKWYGSDATVQNGRKAGNYASVKISAPEIYSAEELLAKATIKIDDREIVDWNTVIDTSQGEDTYFVFYPRFDATTKTHTVAITWEDGSVQEFVIELGEEATLEKAPSAKLEKGDATGGDLEYTIDGKNVTINGNVLWYKSGPNQNGRKAGNYASVRISAPENYTKEFLIANTKLVINGKDVLWSEVIDETIGEDTFFVLYPRFDATTKTHTIVITWENGNTETITISLSENATLESALAGSIALDETTKSNLKSELKDNTLTLDGTINYVKNKGNVFGYTITASEEYSNEELQNAKITINNYGKNGQVTKVIDTDGATLFGANNYFTVTNIATSNFGYDEIIIIWENGNTQIIKVEFADTLVLEEKPTFVEKIELNFDNASIIKGDTLTLEATITPENATNKDIIWTSTNEEVATVDEFGVVTALSYGKTTIIATTVDGKFVAECEINVVYPRIETTLEKNETITNVGDIFSRTVTIDFTTIGGNEEYTYSFTIKNTETNEEVTNYVFDEENANLTLTITDKNASYEITYVIEDTVGNKLESKLVIEAFEK